MSRVNETKFLVPHESCKCGLFESVCNSRQKWNHDKCECKTPTNWNSFEKGYMWNTSTCDWECDKTCRIGLYLNIKNSACKERVINNKMIRQMLNTTEAASIMYINLFSLVYSVFIT